MKSKIIKDKHELSVCKRYLSLYNDKYNKNLNLIRQGVPQNKEPDCICSDNFAIEIVGVYDNEYQAKKMHDLARGKVIRRKPQMELLTLDNLGNEI